MGIASEFWPAAGLRAEWERTLSAMPLAAMLAAARALARAHHGGHVSFSPKVFIPLTRLCRDACGYCTFARPPRKGERAFMSAEEVLEVARAGAVAGCSEALFTLGELPEQRYRVVREELAQLGFESTIDYLAAMANLVLRETGLIPHLNAGVMSRADLLKLRSAGASQGLMLEGTSSMLTMKGGPHYRSKGKQPEIRVETIADAGEAAIPFTTGILIGLGESRADRIESLLVIKALHERYGHIQEVIVQNFQPKPGTRMSGVEAPSMDDVLWTAAAARLILGGSMNIQVPPNLSHHRFPELLEAGINDWGGISPVTPDHVNPEAAWPALQRLEEATEAAELSLVARLPVYPEFLSRSERWLEPAVATAVLRASDVEGWARRDHWSPGLSEVRPEFACRGRSGTSRLESTLRSARAGRELSHAEIVHLLSVRGSEVGIVLEAADQLRAAACGDAVRYVVNRNINYTNVCTYKCSFCAFSKGKGAEHLRGRAYDLTLDEVSRRSAEAWDRGATEVCMQGGIHPGYTGHTYLELLAAAKRGAPALHVHAFSPLEVTHGASTLGISIERFLHMLREAGLGSLPGTAAEILDDEARAILCPDKIDTQQWLNVLRQAHRVGLPTTSTIMFGHIDSLAQWATHIVLLRDLQKETGGITEFVPLPFVHMEAPLYYRGRARKGPTFRETMLLHAVARLALYPHITNIQASWVKLGATGVAEALRSGVNDLGGTLMNESISRAAGTQHGQELPPAEMDALIRSVGRMPGQRTTLYREVPEEQSRMSYQARPLEAVVNAPVTGKRLRSDYQPLAIA